MPTTDFLRVLCHFTSSRLYCPQWQEPTQSLAEEKGGRIKLPGKALTANTIGIATSESYYDALSGVTLCGRNKAPMLLVSDGASIQFASSLRLARAQSIMDIYLVARQWKVPLRAMRLKRSCCKEGQ